MKKIKALLGGLVLSMVLVALFPSAFMKGDAKWTFAGDAHDGKIDVTGKNLELDRPRFYLDDNRNQGIVANFPVSYLRRSYQVTLKPRGNAKEISLVMGFRGKNFSFVIRGNLHTFVLRIYELMGKPSPRRKLFGTINHSGIGQRTYLTIRWSL